MTSTPSNVPAPSVLLIPLRRTSSVRMPPQKLSVSPSPPHPKNSKSLTPVAVQDPKPTSMPLTSVCANTPPPPAFPVELKVPLPETTAKSRLSAWARAPVCGMPVPVWMNALATWYLNLSGAPAVAFVTARNDTTRRATATSATIRFFMSDHLHQVERGREPMERVGGPR
jgi:hypothetical protein